VAFAPHELHSEQLTPPGRSQTTLSIQSARHPKPVGQSWVAGIKRLGHHEAEQSIAILQSDLATEGRPCLRSRDPDPVEVDSSRGYSFAQQ